MSDITHIIFHAKRSIDSFHSWMAEKVSPLAKASYPLELSTWFNELDLIRALVERPDRIRIALVGTTGAGKSTFLNAVLGQEILPVGVMQPCTAFVISVVRSKDSQYEVSVQFCTSEEWKKDLECLIATC
jgi:predicted GTPase